MARLTSFLFLLIVYWVSLSVVAKRVQLRVIFSLIFELQNALCRNRQFAIPVDDSKSIRLNLRLISGANAIEFITRGNLPIE